MLAHVREQKRRNAVRRREDLESRLARVREKEEKMKARYESGEPMSKRRVSSDVRRHGYKYVSGETDGQHRKSTTEEIK